MAAEPLRQARAYLAAGLSVIPIAHGTKEPAIQRLPRVYDAESGKSRPSWRMFQDRLPSDQELNDWFDGPEQGIGIICGSVSGGLVVLDLESPELYERWRTFALTLLDADLLDSLPVVASGKGRHVYLRMAEPLGNRKLAMAERVVLAETRGQGGYIVAPPSLHPSGKHYALLSGDLSVIPLLDPSAAQALLDAARALAPAHDSNLSAETQCVSALSVPGAPDQVGKNRLVLGLPLDDDALYSVVVPHCISL